MTEADGAGDKLFHEESPNSVKDSVEVKFVPSNVAKNGDAKINIGDLRSACAGMGKEELMKFANDPFWVRLRWFLFVCFWLIWFAMLFGAVAIIVLAPKCSSHDNKEYYDKSPLYEIDVKTFGDLKGIASKVDYLKELGVQQVSLSSILKTSGDGEGVVDFKAIDPALGTLEDFKELVTKLKAADIHLIVSFSPDHSSTQHEFFNQSVKQQAPYSDYYVWAKPAAFGSDNLPLPPNNWKSKQGGSAWAYNAERKEFYLRQFGENQADFNLHNQAVRQYFNEVLEFWLQHGASGFKLQDIEYLLEDSDLRNETLSNKPVDASHDDYKFFSHQRTTLVPGIGKILDAWGATVHNRTGGVLIVEDSLTEESAQVNIVFHKQEVNASLTAQHLNAIVEKWTKEKVSWQWVCADGTLKCTISSELLNILNMVTLLLPRTPLTRSGQELGLNAPSVASWTTVSQSQSADPQSHLSLYKHLVKQRRVSPVLDGDLQTAYNGTVFAFKRKKSDKPDGILVAVNMDSTKSQTVNLATQLSEIPAELKVLFTTKQLASSYPANFTVPSGSVQLPPYAGVVFSFAPQPAVA